jgi:hypothetical protein
MSEFYVYDGDDNGFNNTGSVVNLWETESNYYGVPMKFSKIKEKQFKNIMSNIGNNPAVIDYVQTKKTNTPMNSLYGSNKEFCVSNYPELNKGYYLSETNYQALGSKLTSDLFNKYNQESINIWNAKLAQYNNTSNIPDSAYTYNMGECNWFIDPSDWTIRNFYTGLVLGKVTNIETF